MKLKVLFFPIILVISVSVFFGFIVPKWNSISDNAEKVKERETHVDILSRKGANIISLEKNLLLHGEEKDILYKFLPSEVEQEKVVNSMSRLADSSGISLIDVTFQKKSNDEEDEEIIDPSKLPLFSAADDVSPVADDMLQHNLPRNKTKHSMVDMTFVGSYDSTRTFIVGIESMDILGSVKTIEMTKLADDESSEGIVSGHISVAFSYMSKATVSQGYSEEFFNNSTFDYSVASKISDDISNSTSNLSLGSIGTANPFIFSSGLIDASLQEAVTEEPQSAVSTEEAETVINELTGALDQAGV